MIVDKELSSIPRMYKCLPQYEFIYGKYKLVSVRDEDKYAILNWRNDQISILRQRQPLTIEKQEWYFKNVIDPLFKQEKPSQILFSFFENDTLIGYGGLVHIDWESRNGEMSFLLETKRNKTEDFFVSDFAGYLRIITAIAFQHLQFVKIHTTVFDLPERVLYRKVIETSSFVREAELKDHVICNGKMCNVLIYSCFNHLE